MTTHVAAINIRIDVLPFLSSIEPETRQNYLTPDERAASQTRIEIPRKIISRVEYDDGMESSSFTILLANAAFKRFNFNEYKNLRVDTICRKGNIVAIYENGELQFAGLITDLTEPVNAETGEADLELSGAGLEELVRQMTTFVDLGLTDTETSQARNPAAAMSVPNRFTGAIAVFAKTIKTFKQADLCIKKLMGIIFELLGGLYGGEKIAAFIDSNSGISADTYTRGFLHVINWPKTVSFGARINWWQMVQTFAAPPLYELFFVADQKPYRMDDGNTSEWEGNESNIGRLIYRKTPFDQMETVTGQEDHELYYNLDASKIIGQNLTDSVLDVFSGVHVSPNHFGNALSVLVNPVTYATDLLEQYGQRVLEVPLDGVQFPEQDESHKSSYKEQLARIQEKIYQAFGKGDRTISGSLSIHYSSRSATKNGQTTPGISKGKIIKISDLNELKDSELKPLLKYEGVFYCNSVATVFDVENGSVNQRIGMKWGRRKDRISPPDGATVRTQYTLV